MDIKGTQTEKNLQTAFAGESQARNKYTYFASQAKKEGYEQIAAIFLETAENEKEHAKMWYKLLNGGVGTTAENLKAAAREEGFEYIAKLFEGVAAIEKHHEERYRKLLKNIEDKLVFSSEGDAIWQCRNCGHIVVGTKAPELCPVCNHPQSYFEVHMDNF